MSPNADNNDTKVSFSENADVEGGVPVAVADAPAEQPSTTLRATKDRQSISQSCKAWDIDGDGQLDDTELALKGLDKSGKGTLSKEQMYQLMHQNLAVQKELSGVKKVVYGLVGFTVVLALANVGTSFAAAYLSKDTKMEDGKLTDKDGKTVQTDTSVTAFEVNPEEDNLFNEYRRELCTVTSSGNGGNAVHNAVDCAATAGSGVHWFTSTDGEAFIDACESGGSASIRKEWTGSCISTHHFCGTDAPGEAVVQRHSRNIYYLESVGNAPYNMKVTWEPTHSMYKIWELKNGATDNGHAGCCDADSDCYEGICTNNRCTTTVSGVGEEAPSTGGDEPATGGGSVTECGSKGQGEACNDQATNPPDCACGLTCETSVSTGEIGVTVLTCNPIN
jgi:hypothetical protein